MNVNVMLRFTGRSQDVAEDYKSEIQCEKPIVIKTGGSFVVSPDTGANAGNAGGCHDATAAANAALCHHRWVRILICFGMLC